MTNLIFDLNNILYRSLFVIGGFGKRSYTFDSQKEIDELMRKLSMDTAFLIRLINPSRVIFALDGKSWRKDIFIEENEGYKGDRKKSKIINWENIFKTLDEFIQIIEDNGMIVTKIDTAEADDIIAMWVDELLYNKKQHVISVSGDEDIRQLVKSYTSDDNREIFSTVFNPFMQGKNASRKLYYPHKFKDWLEKEEEVDIWNMSGSIDVDKNDFRRIRDTEKVRIEEVNGNLIALRKVFCGDDGDNIPAIYTWISETAGGEEKEVRITNSKFEKILESIKNEFEPEINHEDLWTKRNQIFQEIKKITKTDPTFKIDKRLKRQLKLVVLDPKLFPETIIDEFNKIKEEQLNKSRPNVGDINMNNMLQGTRYVRASQGGTGTGNEASIFKEIDKLSSKSLF